MPSYRIFPRSCLTVVRVLDFKISRSHLPCLHSVFRPSRANRCVRFVPLGSNQSGRSTSRIRQRAGGADQSRVTLQPVPPLLYTDPLPFLEQSKSKQGRRVDDATKTRHEKTRAPPTIQSSCSAANTDGIAGAQTFVFGTVLWKEAPYERASLPTVQDRCMVLLHYYFLLRPRVSPPVHSHTRHRTRDPRLWVRLRGPPWKEKGFAKWRDLGGNIGLKEWYFKEG